MVLGLGCTLGLQNEWTHSECTAALIGTMPVRQIDAHRILRLMPMIELLKSMEERHSSNLKSMRLAIELNSISRIIRLALPTLA